MKRLPRLSPPGSARLFSDLHPAAPPAGVHIANIDGASRGNPGPASYAVVLRHPSGKVILELARKLGRETNNVAEYYALLAVLDFAATHGIVALRVRSDSELLVRQMQGHYKVKSADLKPLQERATRIARQLEYFAIEHVPREMNRDADSLANAALDTGGVLKFKDRNRRVESPSETAPRTPRTQGPPSPQARHPSHFVRARFERGVLVPIEPLDLPEGSEVKLDLHIAQKE